MNLDEKFIPLFNSFYDFIHKLIILIAKSFGYPKNPGMPVIGTFSDKVYERLELRKLLPVHDVIWRGLFNAESWFEVIFGVYPKLNPIPKFIYESKEEGFYNFYIINYKNLYFMPNILSEFLQVKLHVCLDLTTLESFREILFLGFIFYYYVVKLRLITMWLISINPYSFPWCYLVALVDWIEDFLQGLNPSVLGINLISTFLLSIVGAIGDSLNHLVFTMPFLPSEGEKSVLVIKDKLCHVLVFHYLPVLWYKYPIPNEIREFWFNERPDILEYMQKAYKDFDIQFLPENILK